jgi:hypothetical protein
MARADRPPSTARAIAAFNAGYRLAAFDTPDIARRMAAGDPCRDWLTVGELAALRLSNDREWSRWWWRGYTRRRETNV